MTRRSGHHAPTSILFVTLGLFYLGLLILFAWQTIEFVNWLFPGEQLVFKILTFICFDVAAIVWLMIEVFFKKFDSRSETIAIVASIGTFLLSLVATVLYMVIQGVFRFRLVVTQDMVTAGDIVSIVALVGNILLVMTFLYFEVVARLAYKQSHSRYMRRKTRNVTQSNVTGVTPPQLTQNASVTRNVTPLRSRNAQRQQRYRDRRKGFMP